MEALSWFSPSTNVSFDRLLTGERGKGSLQALSPSWDKKPGREGRGRRQLWLCGQLSVHVGLSGAPCIRASSGV